MPGEADELSYITATNELFDSKYSDLNADINVNDKGFYFDYINNAPIIWPN